MANDNFDLPRPTDAVPSATSTVLNDNSKVLDYVINGEGTVINRVGAELLTLDEAVARINWAYVGLFADGVTFTAKTDFAVDAVGTQWVYNGLYPFVATAGTVPSSPDYQVVHVASHKQLSERNPADGSAHNANDIADSNGDTVQDYLESHRTDNTSYKTTEQETFYTMPQNRHVFGQEYLWGMHKYILDGKNLLPLKIVWSGDSTTAGDNSSGWTPSILGAVMGAKLGLWDSTHINSGHSGDSSVQWNSTHVGADIIAHPDMNLYVARWGVNDGSEHGNVSTFIANMDAGLAKLRVFKSVSNLAIVVMAPSSTDSPSTNRDTDWYEQIIPELRKICRKYQAVFFDTYAMFQDSKQGAGLWMDNPGGAGSIHPDGTFNHTIVWPVMQMMFQDILNGQNLASNNFINTSSANLTPGESIVPSNYTMGMSMWTIRISNSWPVNGKMRSWRNGSKVFQEIYETGDDDTGPTDLARPSLYRWGDTGADTWSKFYGLPVEPTLLNSWAAVASRTPKYVHKSDGTCVLMGTIGGGVDGTEVFTLPAEMQPSSPRTFIVAGSSAASPGTIVINTSGRVDAYMNGSTFINFDGVVWSAGS